MNFSFELLLFSILAAAFVVGIALLVFLLCRQKSKPGTAPLPPYGKVHFDKNGIVLHREDYEKDILPWRELTKLRILTTPDGPFLPDVFWVVEAEYGIAMKIPSETEGMSELSDHLMTLPGFRSEEMIKAMSSTEYASFEVWTKGSATTSF